MMAPGHPPVGLRDSKQLTPPRRELLFQFLIETCLAHSVGQAEVAEIDKMGIARASLLAMARAVEGLHPAAQALIVDAFLVPGLGLPQLAFARADQSCPAVMAASIVAKVTRDRLMVDLDVRHPGYGFAHHKGYGTASHQSALRAAGRCRAHRLSFAPIRALDPLPG